MLFPTDQEMKRPSVITVWPLPRSHDLWVRQDGANNVIIRKPASAGYETAPVVMLQGSYGYGMRKKQ